MLPQSRREDGTLVSASDHLKNKLLWSNRRVLVGVGVSRRDDERRWGRILVVGDKSLEEI